MFMSLRLTKLMQCRHMLSQVALSSKLLGTNVTLKSCGIACCVYSGDMHFETTFLRKDLWTNLTLKFFDITNTMDCRKVSLEIAFKHELPAAKLAVVPCVRMLRSAVAGALSMRCVVVSADRWLVAEHHVTDLTPDAGGPCLKYTKRNNCIICMWRMMLKAKCEWPRDKW